MKALALVVLVLSALSFQTSFADDFPTGPIKQLTPGKLCDQPAEYRYPEKIAYCERDVAPAVKYKLMADYDRMFSFHIETMPRSDFKIDHYIPLCVGGSNDVSNLWPQHKSVYTITDPLEEAVCEKMANGKLLQKDAVKLIVEAKNHLDEVPQILAQVHAM